MIAYFLISKGARLFTGPRRPLARIIPAG